MRTPYTLLIDVQDSRWQGDLCDSIRKAHRGFYEWLQIDYDTCHEILEHNPHLRKSPDVPSQECDPQQWHDHEVSLMLSNDVTIQPLNARWRGKDSPTDVLAFPQPQAPHHAGMPIMMGDIIMAYETVTHDAKVLQRDVAQHVSHIFLHGLLHLLGYDHQTTVMREAMEPLEIAALAHLAIENPYR
ncbi:MAG: rRNA maturation RNase YbeY [Pseudomonadota bacterium]